MNNTTTDISTMKNIIVDLSNEEFKQLLDKSSEPVLEQFNDMNTRKAYHYDSKATFYICVHTIATSSFISTQNH